MKQWPGLPRRPQPVEVLAREAQGSDRSVSAPLDAEAAAADGEVMTYSQQDQRSKPVARIIKPADDRASLKALLEGVTPMQPRDTTFPPRVHIPTGVHWNDDLNASEILLREISDRLDALESSGALPTSVTFTSSSAAYVAVPERPTSLGEAVVALERSVMFIDPGSAKELLRRVRRTRGVLRDVVEKSELTPFQRDEFLKLHDATASVAEDEAYVRYLRDRVETLAPLHAAAKQNFAAVADAVSALQMTRNVCRDLNEALTQMEDIAAGNDQDVHSFADDLRRRLRAVTTLEASL